jgi:hypothetical protein
MRWPSVLMLLLGVIGGCNSYQPVPLPDIEAKPEKVLNQQAKIHFAGAVVDTTAGRSQRPSRFNPSPQAPDSLLWLHISRVDYPMVLGTIDEPKMFVENSTDTLAVNLLDTKELEVKQFSSGYTLLFFLVSGLVLWVNDNF